tara:strand:- start:29 stop:289 length:261 start_codon:yes stop_codon:yes gene_type:complete
MSYNERLVDVIEWLGKSDKTYASTANVLKRLPMELSVYRAIHGRRPFGTNRHVLQRATSWIEENPEEPDPDPKSLIKIGRRKLIAM